MSRKKGIPTLRKHASGQAVVWLDGKDRYCGKHGSAEARLKYDALIAEWLANGRKLPRADKALTVTDLAKAYAASAAAHYVRSDNTQTSHVKQVQYVCNEWSKLQGAIELAKYTSADMRILRDSFAEHSKGLSHKTICNYLSVVKQCILFGEERNWIDSTIGVGIRSVKVPTRGPNSGYRPEKITAIDETHIPLIFAKMEPTIRNYFEVMLLTGARPGELLQYHDSFVDKSRSVWRYKPPIHKNHWRMMERVVFIGPLAQSLLSQTRHWPETLRGIRHALDSSTKRAGVSHYSPNQFRHSAATRIAHKHGVEAARVILGHSVGNAITSIYAERDYQLAEKVALDMG